MKSGPPRKFLIRLTGFLLALGSVVLAGRLFWSVYRLTETQIKLANNAWAVQGNITEKLIQTVPEGLFPFSIRVYVVRYTFPAPPQGSMRNGEQWVTRRTFERLGDPGKPVTVTLSKDDIRITAIDPRITFPPQTAYRFGLGVLSLYGSVALAGAGLILTRS